MLKRLNKSVLKRLSKLKRSLFKLIYLFSKPVKEDIVFFDSLFPLSRLCDFRNIELVSLLQIIPTFVTYTISYEGRVSGTIMSKKDFKKNRENYQQNKERIKYLNPYKKYEINLAYTMFLSQVYRLLPFFEKNKIPFIFTLYLGGNFGLNNDCSDKQLKEVFASKYFQKVIVTHNVTYDYLLNKKLCCKEKIEFLFGGYSQFKIEEIDISKKQFYNKNKNTFDICFYSFKYSTRGYDKGYDLFIEAAKKLVKNLKNTRYRFHVIGNFDKNDIDISEIQNQIFFHGVRLPDWLKEFNYKVDILLSPIRQFQLYPGNFNGYPAGYEQSLFGAAIFTTDELNLNDGNYEDNEIVHIKLDSDDIVSKIEFYFNNLDKLYQLAENGRLKTQSLFNLEKRLNAVTNILLNNKQ